MQAVEDTDDALLQRSAPHDAIVNDNQIISVWNQASVSDVINMGGKVIPRISFGNEGAELDVLYRHFLAPDTLRKDLLQFGMAGLMPERFDALHFKLVQVIVESFNQQLSG